jgi:hypothetical protein
MEAIKLKNTLKDDKIYHNQVILSNKNIEVKNINKIIYPLMRLLHLDESIVILLLKKVIIYKNGVCFRGSAEACETMVEDLRSLNLESFIV